MPRATSQMQDLKVKKKMQGEMRRDMTTWVIMAIRRDPWTTTKRWRRSTAR